MTLSRFLNYVQYSTECPADVHAGRWRAMLGQWYCNGLSFFRLE